MARKPQSAEKAEAFRSRVIDAAIELFAEKGPANVSMREIAVAVGVSAMTPYLYFADKDALFTAVRAAALTRFSDCLAASVEGKSAIDASRAISRAYVDFALGEPGMYRLLFDYEMPDGDGAPELIATSRRARDTLTSYVGPLIDENLIVGDPNMIGLMFWASLHGALVLQRAGALGGVDPEALRKALAQTIFRGLRPAQPNGLDPSQ